MIRERAAVARAATTAPKRVGHIRVDGDSFDQAYLDSFLGKTRVFLSYARTDHEAVAPFATVLRSSGFDLPRMEEAGVNFATGATEDISSAARHGYVLVFLSAKSMRNESVLSELLLAASVGDRIVPVLLEPLPLWDSAESLLSNWEVFRAYGDLKNAPLHLADLLLRR